jgi:hypothetical protein
MGHDHHHHSSSDYFMEQVCTLGICAAMGVVMILLYTNDVLGIYLNGKFHVFVLWSGISLLVLVAIRLPFLWLDSGRLKMAEGHNHDHDHDHAHAHEHHHDHGHEHAHGHEHHHHEHDHDHEHAHAHHHDHDHTHDDLAEDDHGHDHSFSPWRYCVLLLPVVLFLLKVPWPDPPEPDDGIPYFSIVDVERAAYTPDSR